MKLAASAASDMDKKVYPYCAYPLFHSELNGKTIDDKASFPLDCNHRILQIYRRLKIILLFRKETFINE